MTKKEFEKLLTKATKLAFDFGQEHVSNQLHSSIIYDVKLNSSYDDPKLTQFDFYPEDNGKELKALSKSEIVDLLFRKNKVPVWIDISLKYVTKSNIIVNLICAGRYTDDWSEMYYHSGNTGPFGIKSPSLPKNYKKGQKFDITNKTKPC